MVKSRGFTLIEFTIVLAIAFILIGGVLKVTSMLDEAKTNDVIAIAADLSEAARIFKEKYKMLPGDAPNVGAVLPGVAAPYGGSTDEGNGNGEIGTAAESHNATDHLFRAELVRRRPGGHIVSRYGNVWIMARTLAITGDSPCGTPIDNTAPEPIARNVIVFSNLPVEAAREIDTKFDDGNPSQGSIRASTPYVGEDSVPVVLCFAVPL